MVAGSIADPAWSFIIAASRHLHELDIRRRRAQGQNRKPKGSRLKGQTYDMVKQDHLRSPWTSNHAFVAVVRNNGN